MIANLMLALVAGANPSTDTPHGSEPPVVERALDHLFDLSRRSLCVRQTIAGYRVEGDVDAPIPDVHPYAGLVQLARAGDNATYREVFLGAWSGGKLCSLAFDPHLAPDASREAPEFALYWPGSRGLVVDFTRGNARIVSTYGGFGFQFLPHELHGFYAATPLVLMARLAQSGSTLEVVEQDPNRVVLRFPCDPSLNPTSFAFGSGPTPMLEVEIDVHRSRLVRVAYFTEAQGVYDEFRVLVWDEDAHSLPFAAKLEYTVYLAPFPRVFSDESRGITFSIVNERLAPPALDGRSVLDLVSTVGFLNTGGHTYASSLGGDALVQAGLSHFLEGERRDALAAVLETELAGRVQRVLSTSIDRLRESEAGEWPELSLDTIETSIVRALDPFDVERQYCSQVSVCTLRRLLADPVRFSDVVERHPGERLSMAGVIDCLHEAGLDYAVAKSNRIDTVVGPEPFLMLLGTDPSRGHLAVVKRTSPEQYRLWAPPHTNDLVSGATLNALGTHGVYVVPAAWTEGHGRPWWALSVALLLVGLFGFALLWGARTRRALSALLALALAALVSSCSPRGPHGAESVVTADGRSALLEPAHPLFSFEVGVSETRRVAVELVNRTEELVTVSRGSSSCACVRYVDGVYTVPPRATAAVPLVVLGASPGLTNLTLHLLAGANGRTQLLPVRVRVHTGSPVFTTPAAIQLSGSGRSLISSAFELVVVEAGSELPGVTWTTDPEGLELSIAHTSSEQAFGATAHRIMFDCRLPAIDPGPRFGSVLLDAEGFDPIRRSVALLITE